MHVSIGRRLAGATLVALLAAAASATGAAAQGRCAAPDEPGWRSCLTASHHANPGADDVHLTRARPRLTIRYDDGCPAGRDLRTVTLRTGEGRRLGRTTLRSRCRRGVARWNANLKLELDLPRGTVVRSFWTRIADTRSAPRVELNG